VIVASEAVLVEPKQFFHRKLQHVNVDAVENGQQVEVQCWTKANAYEI
jgi:hypothetical protein